MARLEVEIGADISGLEKALNQAEVDMIKFARGIKKGGNAIPPFNKKVVNAVPAMTSFSQAIQDAPFGIQGVANNLQQLTAQLGYLSTQAGGAGNAFKEMWKTLRGPAGILLAVSLITVALQLMERGLFKSKSAAEKAAEANKKVAESLKKFIDELETLEKIQLKGEQNAQKELRNLKNLSDQIDNNTLSVDKRTAAIEELRKKYPTYLQDMSDEKILTDGLGVSYSILKDAIIAKARAQALNKTIVDNEVKLLALEKQITDETAKNLEARSKLEASGTLRRRRGRQEGGVALSNLEKEEAAVVDLTTAYEKLRAETDGLIDRASGVAGEGLSGAQIGGDGKTDPRKAFEGRFKALQFYSERAFNLEKETQDAIARLQADGLKQAEVVELSAGERRLRNQRYIQTQSEEMAHAHYVRLQLQLQAFNQAASDIINTGITDTLGGLGEAIGGAIGEGTNVLQAGGKALLEGLADIVIRLGKLAIATGVGMEAIKTAFKTFGGLGAIAAGVALVALGSAIKGAIGNIGSDLGGTGSAGSDIPTGSNPSFSEGGGQIILTVEGTQLIGVINNTTRQDISMGGSIGILGR